MSKSGTTAAKSGATSVADSVVSAIGVGKKYGGFWALSDVSMHVTRNEVLGIIGPNGAGKTTLFNILAGAVKPTTGRVYLQGNDITSQSPHRRARAGIGRTFQLPQPVPSLSTHDNIYVAALACGQPRRQAVERTAEVLEYTGIAPIGAKLARDLNAVESKRLEVSRALSVKPSVLLLDEIFSGSNSDEIDELIELVHQLRADGLTVLVIEHHVRAIRAVADRVVAINAGKIISEGAPDHVFADPQVVESYLGRHASA